MKIFFRNIHLYLGLAAGLVIMTCCFTGAILVFEKELQEAFNHNRYFVKEQSVRLPVEQLINNVKQKYPAAKIASVKLYANNERSLEIGISQPEKHGERNANERTKGQQKRNEDDRQGTNKEASQKNNNSAEAKEKGSVKQNEDKKVKQPAGPGGSRPTHTVFINPYTGEILELYSYRETFFYTMFSLHRWLLGGEDSIGKTITGISTIIFLFILITGIILWWPRNKAILKQRLKIKTDASFKRLNHDLHIVLGFYSAIFLFIFAFTALSWSYKWFNNGIYTVTGTSMKPSEPPQSAFAPDKKRISYDSAFTTITNAVRDVKFFNLRGPNDSVGVYTATVLSMRVHESASDNYYIDQYSGQVIGSLKYAEKNLGQRVRSTFKPVHVGSIFGWPSKIIAFLVCLLGVTFPVTGVIMWLKRLKKNKARKTIRKEISVVV